VVAQVLVDDAGPDVGHLGAFGQLVDAARERGAVALKSRYRELLRAR